MSMKHIPLPRMAYIDRTWFQKEQEKLMGCSWVFAGVTSDFEQPGDFATIQVGSFGLFVMRVADGTHKAFHNICRHRGAELLEGQGNAGSTLVCPYHRWTYDLEGQFRGAPNLAACFPDLKAESMSLKPAALGVFQNLIFVNPDPLANFDQWIHPLSAHAWPHDPDWPHLIEGAPFTYDMACDWKVFVENAIDGYHLAYLHERTLGGPVPDENVWERRGDHSVWYATDEPGIRHSQTAKTRRDYAAVNAEIIPGAEEVGYGGVYHLFPATFIVSTPYVFSVTWLQATAPGHSHLHVRTWGLEKQHEASLTHIPGYDAESGMITSARWTVPALEAGDFQTEDVWICEKVQRGLNSPAFELGPLSRGAGAEDPIRWFHQSVQDRLG